MKENSLVDISNDLYHSDKEYTSASKLKKALYSLRDYNEYRPMGWRDYFDVGSAFELLLCEPTSFIDAVAVFNPMLRPNPIQTFANKENKVWKADFYSDNSGKLIVSTDDVKMIHSMVKQALSDPIMSGFVADGLFQKSVFWTDQNGFKVKTRPDIIFPLEGNDVINVDVKSISKQSEFPFQMKKLNYPLQAVMQVLGLEAAGYNVVNSFWLVVDKVEYPRAVLYSFTNEQIREMKEIYFDTTRRVKNAIEQDYYPTYSQEFGNEIGAIELDLDSYFNYLKR